MAAQTDVDPGLGPISRDGILNKAVFLWQPQQGYRFATDAVFLAASVDAQPGEKVLDVGCGVGAAGLALAWRCAGIALTGCDIDDQLLRLARRNARENNLAAEFLQLDVRGGVPASLSGQFDHVVCNPPFHSRSASRPSPHASRAQALVSEDEELSLWLRFCAEALAQGGQAHLIFRADRTAELVRQAGQSFASIQLRHVHPKADRPASRVLVVLTRSASQKEKDLPPLVLHEGDGSWTPTASRILRGASILQAQAVQGHRAVHS